MHLDEEPCSGDIEPHLAAASDPSASREGHRSLDRRALIRRAAIGGAAAWAAPVVLSSPAYAIGSTCSLCGTGNLIVNPSAETSPITGAGGWTVTRGLNSSAYGGAGRPAASSLVPNPGTQGSRFFFGGTNALSPSTATQVINTAACALSADNNHLRYTLSGYLGGWQDQADNAVVVATFLNAANGTISSAQIGPVTPADRGNVTGLLFRTTTGSVPAGTRSVRITLTCTRTSGTDNDGYADLLNFSLTCVP